MSLKLRNIRKTTGVYQKAIQVHCHQYPDFQRDAEAVVELFSKLMKLFRKCHRGYNSAKYMSDKKIDKLGKYKCLPL